MKTVIEIEPVSGDQDTEAWHPFDGTDWEKGIFCQLAGGLWKVKIEGDALQWSMTGTFLVKVFDDSPSEGLWKKIEPNDPAQN